MSLAHFSHKGIDRNGHISGVDHPFEFHPLIAVVFAFKLHLSSSLEFQVLATSFKVNAPPEREFWTQKQLLTCPD